MQVRVAIVQAEPVYLDLAASVDRVVDLTATAAGRGAQLVVFGETWLPGYPAWLDECPGAALWDHAPTKEVFLRLRRNSLVVPSPECELLADAARRHEVTLVVGVNERVDEGPGNGTLYNSILVFGPDGSLLNRHRKLVPTYTERLVWGQGDADGLRTVETPVGRLGALVCWEHWMPLARQALHVAGEQIHVALWPTVKESHQLASRHYAFEGRCFVLAAGTLMRARDLPAEFSLEEDPERWLLRGGSAIAGPDGTWIAEPVFDEETIVVAELELDAIDRGRLTLDVTGHYSRPDVFEFGVRR
ncbi:MAG: carbon-nitrogen hydrolase family protein [Gaiellaceae bacterium MAG52_C11]|nr:carbon-nitrogen hydrolase family protein [Candidatus Gaiellasilicea maunaloa]